MKNLFLFLLLLTLSGNTQALKQEDLLTSDQAFQFSAEPVDNGLVRLTWDIADGYYLYRKRFTLESLTNNISLDQKAAAFPDSKTKSEPNLGDMEVYYKQVAIDVPIKRDANSQAALELKLKVGFQGCANAGLCFPPQTEKAKITLAAIEETSPTTATSQTPAPQVSLASLKAMRASRTTNTDATARNPDIESNSAVPAAAPKTNEAPSNELAGELTNEPLILPKNIVSSNTPLPIDQAFQFTLKALDKNTLSARWQITPEHQLYRTKINFRVLSPESVQLGVPVFPHGRVVNDEFFGEMEIYDDKLNVIIPLPETTAEQLIIETSYQGCSNSTGICYTPTTKESTISLVGLPEKAFDSDSNSEKNNEPLSNPSTDEFFSGSFLGILLAFFVIGLGLSLTPCIFPMIPILSGIIAGQNELSTYRAFLLSLLYVLASACAYSLIGLVFGFFGENILSNFQHPVAISLFAALFVTFAMSMFGFFDLQMPNSIQSRLNEISNNQRSGSLLGAAIMGFLSTLIVGPCVAPALAAALTYIANSKDAVLGASALFSMGLGMGIILLVVGTLGGHLLPRAGVWMDTTKAIFGIMLLGMAIWMLDRIVPFGITMFLSGMLLVVSGIYMGALDKLQDEATGWKRFWKSIGLIMLFYGAAQLLGVSAGSQNILQPLKGVFSIGSTTSASANQHEGLAFTRIKSLADLNAVIAQARQSKQLVLLDFYADWCVDCIRMEKNVFTDPIVQKALKNVIVLQADVTKRDQDDKDLEKYFGIIGPPTIIFFNKNGTEIKPLRMIGYENTNTFLQRLQQFQNN